MKVFAFVKVVAVTCFLVVTGCHHGYHCQAAEKPFVIVASTFPVYLFTANICVNAENIKLELLVPAMAGCPHDFAPRPQDLQKLARASVLVTNGHGLEEFLEKPLQNIAPDLPVIDAGKNVPVIMDEHSGHGHGPAPNPHTFAAPAEAALMARNISDQLAKLNPDNAAIYETNSKRFCAELEKLSHQLESIGKKAANRKIVLEHDGLAYLAKNANLEVVDIIDHGVSAAALARLGRELREKAPALLAGDAQFPDRLLKTLAQETGIPFTRLGTCANGPEDAPLDYYEAVMEKNINILEKYFEHSRN